MIGTKLAHYEITGHLGTGGMGEVYQAVDSKLGRSVAIKVLPTAFASDAERLLRFRREAQLLASLNHPNIAHIYGLEESGDTRCIVMELVEGETLQARIQRGPIPLEEAVAIAKQIAEALEAAHEKGVVHRDLKPGNVMMTNDGKVKVLDFGLAKAHEGHSSTSALAHSPTMVSMAATNAGVILGTAAYMSPEQARGKSVDQRADIWAFGVVLFEMLTGQRAFPGDDLTDTLASVVKLDPQWESIGPGVTARVRQVVRLCLRKDPKQRIQSIGDVRLALEGAFETAAPPSQSSAPRKWILAFAVAAAGMIVLAVPALRHWRETPLPVTLAANLTMDVAPAEMLGPTNFYSRPSRTAFAISPDGATLVFSGEIKLPTRTRMLYRRPLAEAQATAMPLTEGAEYPFFSPDGQWVGFAAGNKLKKVALSGGPPIEICDFTFDGRIEGASWGSAGIIAFARRGLWTVSDSGGNPEAPFEDDPNTGLYSPNILPDGHTVLFTEAAKWKDAHIDAIDLKTKKRKTLLTNATDARYSPTGHLVFVRNAALLAVPFDAARVEVTGAAVPLLAGVMQSTNAPNGADETGMGQFALSASGMLVYASGDRYPTPSSTLVRVDRKGAETKLAEIKGDLVGLRLSPSGSRVVAFKTGDGSRASDIWMYDLPAGTPTRLTSTGDASWPLFSLDGKSVTFLESGSNPGIYSLPLSGNNAPQRLVEGKAGSLAASWSPDGKWLAVLQPVGNVRQIFVRPVQDSKPVAGEPRQFSPSTFAQTDLEFSPDSRWLAYVSNESGTNEVYVQPFPGPGEKHRISSNGGTNPAWSRNGRELFYFGRSTPEKPERPLMAVEFSTTGDFKAGAPHLLFEGPYYTTTPLRSYEVTPDGQFIMNRQQRPPDQPVTKLNVVLGWADELKRRVR